ncbi:MAG TPA: hypothetical protein VK465_11665 [Fibrobacteria bacterium]|nr:hypothetical protein [Fibrobacteria bacterium]
MKKTSTNIDALLLIPAALLVGACAFTDFGYRINQEQVALARLEEKRHSLETQYIIVLNSLELHPSEAKLLKERDEVRKKLLDLDELIGQKRKDLGLSFMEWEQKIVKERIEREMVEKEIRDNEGVDETQEFENK